MRTIYIIELSVNKLIILKFIEEDFRPISLSNFLRKTILEIMALRIAMILLQLVDDEHAGFVQGTNIVTKIVLTHELIRDLD